MLMSSSRSEEQRIDGRVPICKKYARVYLKYDDRFEPMDEKVFSLEVFAEDAFKMEPPMKRYFDLKFVYQ